MSMFPAMARWRTFVKVGTPQGPRSPEYVYAGTERGARAAARDAAKLPWPIGTQIGILGPCPSSWVGSASCYRCMQRLTQLGWARVNETLDACTTSSYLGGLGQMSMMAPGVPMAGRLARGLSHGVAIGEEQAMDVPTIPMVPSIINENANRQGVVKECYPLLPEQVQAGYVPYCLMQQRRYKRDVALGVVAGMAIGAGLVFLSL